MAFVRYSSDFAKPLPGEEAIVEEVLASLERASKKTFDVSRHPVRQAHAKSHGVLRGELIVYDGLSGELRQGLFAQPAAYPVIVRFSTAPGGIYSDRISSNCGMAIKVFGVAGAKADPADASRNQDFLLVNSPFYFRDAADYLKAQRLIEKMAGASGPLVAVVAKLGHLAKAGYSLFGRAPPTLVSALAAPPHHILGETFHSMAALRYGDYVAKIRAAPLSPSVRALTGVRADRSDSILRDLIVDFFRTQSAEYEICVQLCADLARMPIEDATTVWPDELSPPRPVAKLVLPSPQNAYSPARRVFADEALSYTPWRCLDAHRPLGSVMRLRLRAYALSSRLRHGWNARQEAEPETAAALPD